MGARPGDEPPITLNRLWHQMTRRHVEDEGRWCQNPEVGWAIWVVGRPEKAAKWPQI